MIKKEWFEGTMFIDDRSGFRGTVDYTTIKLFPEPTLLNKNYVRMFEILWSARAKITPIISSDEHCVLIIEKEDTEEIAHAFRKEVLNFIKDNVKANPERDFQLVIKTRIALADPNAYFNEIRHIED